MSTLLPDIGLIAAVTSGAAGVVGTLLTQRLLNKQAQFTYSVMHNRIAVSADDAVFGTVRVTWNDNPTPNLHLSTIELRNESSKDFENIVLRVFTNNSLLLTERAELLGTTRLLEWTAEFAHGLAVEPGAEPTPVQRNRYARQREYLVPLLNRGKSVRLAFLNMGLTDRTPELWVDLQHKGVKLKFRAARNEFLGVPQTAAALSGVAVGLILYLALVRLIETAWILGALCLVYGYLAIFPGAMLVKLWRWMREAVGN